MTLKTCSCGKVNTTKTAKFIGAMTDMGPKLLLFNCANCNSTFSVSKRSKETRFELKHLFTIVALFVLTACGSSGGGSNSTQGGADGSSPSVVAPTTPDNSGTTPANNSQPAVQQPAQPTSPTPAPNLSCYSNNGVFCTGGNVGGSNLIQLDLDRMFTGYNAQLQVVVDSVQNDVTANAHAVCAQQNGAGCYQHSTCVNATILNASNHQSYPYTWCGNAVNLSNNTLIDQ